MSLQNLLKNITSISSIRMEPRLIKCGRMAVYNVGIINMLNYQYAHYNLEFF